MSLDEVGTQAHKGPVPSKRDTMTGAKYPSGHFSGMGDLRGVGGQRKSGAAGVGFGVNRRRVHGDPGNAPNFANLCIGQRSECSAQ